jgi:GntR family transcriptional regulator
LRKRLLVRSQILDLIDGLEPGSIIPGERTLCEQLNVSRMTVRNAVADLVRDGRLERRHGSGTYVAAPKQRRQLGAVSFTESIRGTGSVPSSRTLSSKRAVAGPQTARRLAISPQAEIFVVQRLRLADEVPVAIETLHTPVSLFSERDLLHLDDDTSFYSMLAETGREIADAVQVIEPTVTSELESELLTVPNFSPAFLFELTSKTADGQIVEFVRSVHRGDRYTLEIRLQPDSLPARAASTT